jgi:hypothetical protein
MSEDRNKEKERKEGRKEEKEKKSSLRKRNVKYSSSVDQPKKCRLINSFDDW